MARQRNPVLMGFLMVLTIAAPSTLCETQQVWKSAEIEALAAKTRKPVPLHSGAGYAIHGKSLEKAERSASGERVDQVLWVRRGAGRLSLGSPPRHSEIAAGDLIRIPRRTPYSIEPQGGRLNLIAVRLQPLAVGGNAPPGIRPARGEMGDTLKKAEIDATIARTQANAPLHAQDNFTVNYVLFKGRVGPWESHTGCADIYLVQTGSGVIQLGGSIENAREDSPGEPRGTGMTGSRESEVGAGDLLVIPRGVAHHMNPKSMPLAYLLIKVWSH